MFGITALLSILFFVMFSLLMFQSFTEKSIETAKKKIDIVFFLEKNIPEHKEEMIKAELKIMKKKSEISDYRFISADEGLKVFAKKYPEKYSYWKRNSTDGNPLSASIEVIPQNKNVEELTKKFLSDTYIGIIDSSKIHIVKDSLLRSNKVLEFLFFLQKGIWILVAVMLFAIAGITAAFISSSFFMRQKEVFIMRLVGASHSYIRTPFLVEGLSLVIISVSIGWGIFFFFRKLSISKLLEIFSSPASMQTTIENINGMWGNFLASLPITLSIIFILAFFTAFISIEHALRNKNILGK